VKRLDPSKYHDSASGACILGNYVAVVGEAGSKPYVALLSKSDGSVVREWIGDEPERFYNCVSIDSKLYVVGDLNTHNKLVDLTTITGSSTYSTNLNVLEKISGGELSSHIR